MPSCTSFYFSLLLWPRKKKQKGCGRGKNPLCAIFFTAAPSFHLSHIILAKCGDKLSIFLGARWLHNELKCREKCKFLSKKWHFFWYFQKKFPGAEFGCFLFIFEMAKMYFSQLMEIYQVFHFSSLGFCNVVFKNELVGIFIFNS